MTQRRVRRAISAGGIVLRRKSFEVELLVGKRTKNVEAKWRPMLCQLPKGGAQPKEPLREAALREVREETGYATRLLKKAGIAFWRYERGGATWVETVHYYFMVPCSPHKTPRDAEFDEVMWVTFGDAQSLLSYPEERALTSSLCQEATALVTGSHVTSRKSTVARQTSAHLL